MKRLGIALAIAAVVAVLVWANLRQVRQASAEVVTVRTVKLARKDLTDQVLAPATLEVAREIEVRARVAGPSLKVKVQPGDRVTAGQPLAEVEAAELQAAVRQAEAQLAQAEAQLAQVRRQAELQPEQVRQRLAAAELQVRQAEAALAAARLSASQQQEGARSRLAQARASLESARARLEAGQGGALEVEAALQAMEAARADLAAQAPDSSPAVQEAALRLEQARQGLEQARLEARAQALLPEQLAAAQAQVAAARAALAEARERLDHAVVRAPVAATVLEVPVREGQAVQPGLLVALLGTVDNLVAEVRVDEVDVARVSPGQGATLTTPAFPGQNFPGRVVRVDPRGTRPPGGSATVYRVVVEVQDASGRLRPGMGVDVAIQTARRAGVLAVPAEAVVEEGGTRSVWVVSAGRAARRPVQAGLVTRAEIEITGGLGEGDEVVVGPFSALKALKEGQAVRSEPAAGEGTGGAGSQGETRAPGEGRP